MKLTIDQIPCDLDPSQRIALDYDAQDLADVRSGNKGHALRLRLPATRTNDRIFGFAAEPYTGQRFNAAQHTAVLSDGEAKLLQGSVRLLSAAYDSDPEGYLIEIRSGTSEWARQAAAEMFNTLGISFSGRLTPTMIRQTWTNNTPVKFFPVCRDEYTPELSSVELIPVERFLSVDDYHPFISAATVVQTLFSEAGYTLESDFLNGEFFRSLYLSGAYSSRDTNALRNRMDFLARRTTTAATTANSDGRVYANPYKSINSVGNFVETVNPNDQNDLGETLTDVFSNNHCFTVEDGEIVFRPMTSVTVAFEYHIRYITDHRILDRNRLKGIDSFYLGDGTEVQGALANRYADRRNSTKPAFQYRAIVFNHTEGNSYRLTCTVNGTAGHAIGEFDSRSALVTTPSGSTVTAPVLLCKAAGSTTYTTYTGDWALYDGYIGETGQTEVEMTVRTNPVTVTPTSPKTFSTIYFYGAEPGMKFSLSRQCTLRPDFTGAPGLNTPISFEDVARHRVRKWVVLDALRHLFNLRFYTDEETRTVYVEPADDFYRLGQTFDWSSRIDRSQPILLGDAAQDAERVRIYKYREADGAVTRLNATLEEPFGQWRLVNDSAAAIDRERNLANPFFSPTVSETECYADAPSALVLGVRVLYNMPVPTTVQMWEPKPDSLRTFTAAGWSGGAGSKKLQKTIPLNRVKAELGYSAADYFSLVYELITNRPEVNMEDLTGTELEEAETTLFKQAIAESIRSTMWVGDTSAESGANTFDGFLKTIATYSNNNKVYTYNYETDAMNTPANSVAMFDDLWKNADERLKDLKAEGQLAFFVSSDVYSAYEKHLDSMSTDGAYTDYINGRQNLLYHGIPVVDLRISSYLAKLSSSSPVPKSFCILTDRRNLVLAVNTADFPGNEIRMWYNPDEMENRQRAVFMAGCDVLDEGLVAFASRI